MKIIKAIALNTLKVILREKTLYFLACFIIILGSSSIFLKPLVLGELTKIVYDFATATMLLLGILISVVIGTIVVQKEFKQKTIFLILSQPISRVQFVIGKFIGMILSVIVVEIITAFVFIAIMLVLGIPVSGNFIYSILFIQLQLFIVCGISLFFSSFTTPIAGAVFTFLTVLSGLFISSALSIGPLSNKVPSPVNLILKIISYLLPALAEIDVKILIYYNVPINPNFIFFSISYSFAYILVCLYLTTILFQRKEFL
jgi:ABC-type transport system involved in multi-copper enzyme maturation permease subunit